MIELTFSGQPYAGQASNLYVFARASAIYTGLVGNAHPRVVAKVPPADADAVFSLYNLNGGVVTLVGTVTIPVVGVPIFSGAGSWVIGAGVFATAPTPQDSMMSDITIALAPA